MVGHAEALLLIPLLRRFQVVARLLDKALSLGDQWLDLVTVSKATKALQGRIE